MLLTKRDNQVCYEKETGLITASGFPVGISCRLWGTDKETGKDKGCGIYRAGGKPGSGGAAGENERKAEGTFSDDLRYGRLPLYCQRVRHAGDQWVQHPGNRAL